MTQSVKTKEPPVITTAVIARFNSYVDKSGDCHQWIGPICSNGYGRMGIGKESNYAAHRLSYQIHAGEIPQGLSVLHSCDNPLCVNPEHLRAGTPLENTRDMISRGRGAVGPGEGNHQAKLTREQVIEIRESYRSGKASQRYLAAKYGMGPSTISLIVRGKRWRNADAEAAA